MSFLLLSDSSTSKSEISLSAFSSIGDSKLMTSSSSISKPLVGWFCMKSCLTSLGYFISFMDDERRGGDLERVVTSGIILIRSSRRLLTLTSTSSIQNLIF